MKEKNMPLPDAIILVAAEVDAYRQLKESQGWKNWEAEIDDYLAALQKELCVCSLERVPKLQGEISGLRWMLSIPDQVAEHLELLQKQLKPEATEA